MRPRVSRGRTVTVPATVAACRIVFPSGAVTRTRQVVFATPSTGAVIRQALSTASAGKTVATPAISQVPPRPKTTSGAGGDGGVAGQEQDPDLARGIRGGDRGAAEVRLEDLLGGLAGQRAAAGAVLVEPHAVAVAAAVEADRGRERRDRARERRRGGGGRRDGGGRCRVGRRRRGRRIRRRRCRRSRPSGRRVRRRRRVRGRRRYGRGGRARDPPPARCRSWAARGPRRQPGWQPRARRRCDGGGSGRDRAQGAQVGRWTCSRVCGCRRAPAMALTDPRAQDPGTSMPRRGVPSRACCASTWVTGRPAGPRRWPRGWTASGPEGSRRSRSTSRGAGPRTRWLRSRPRCPTSPASSWAGTRMAGVSRRWPQRGLARVGRSRRVRVPGATGAAGSTGGPDGRPAPPLCRARLPQLPAPPPGRARDRCRTDGPLARDHGAPRSCCRATSDPFARIDLLEAAMPALVAGRLVTYPRLGHSLKPVLDDALDRMAAFLAELDQGR